MGDELIPTGQQALALAGRMANEYADGDIFNDFNGRKSDNTLRAYRADLGSFSTFLRQATDGAVVVSADALQTTPAAWLGVTWGLAVAYRQWLLTQGVSTGTINRRLAAVKVYAKLAAEAGAIDGQDAAKIGSRVQGYTGKAARNVDSERKAAGVATRKSTQKATHVPLTADQVRALKSQPATPQGRRDGLMMALLLDHGLRVGELAMLTVDAFESDEVGMTMRFYRPKVDQWQVHRLTDNARRALIAYLNDDAPESGLLFRRSVKGGELTVGASGITERNLSGRVTILGEHVGIKGLSAHDCRHSWATRAVAAGTDAFALRDAGGWASLAMPSRYVAAAAISNERVKLPE